MTAKSGEDFGESIRRKMSLEINRFWEFYRYELFRELERFYSQNILPKVEDKRGFTRVKLVLQRLALGKVEKVNEENEKDLFNLEWDNLIIVDACRQDFWEEETGMQGSRISKASATVEYIEKNFSEGDFSDYVYVSANPQFSDWKFKEVTGRLPENTFHSVFKTFNTDWDEDANTVLPKDTVRDALTAQKLFQDKKIIVHFLPPHYPFVRNPVGKGGINSDLSAENLSAWDLAKRGMLDQETVEQSYRENMSYVESFVRELADELNGSTVLTSDHGNFVGEQGYYGHPAGRKEKPLRQVPYVRMGEGV